MPRTYDVNEILKHSGWTGSSMVPFAIIYAAFIIAEALCAVQKEATHE